MRVIWVRSQRGGTVASPTPPLPSPQPAPPPKEQRPRKSRRREALGKGEQPSLAGWLTRPEKPSLEEGLHTFENKGQMEVQTVDLVGTVQEQDEEPDIAIDKPENGVGPDYQNQKLETHTTPSGGAERKHTDEKAICSFKRGGYCLTHECNSKKINVSAKVWKDKGGGKGFGYVTTKKIKYICEIGSISTNRFSEIPEIMREGPIIEIVFIGK